MLQGKTVAVVISAFNEETQIKFVLEGLPDFVDRIVVVDDCSRDQTATIVASLISRHPGPKHSKPVFVNTNPRYSEADRKILELFEAEVKNLVPFEMHNTSPETDKIILLRNKINGGKGMAQAVGYAWCRDWGFDCIATMDGDGQMDPSELEALCLPIVTGEVDYTKGNRLIHKTASKLIPRVRFFGNSVLSILTKMASGYWYVSDTQTGYTAINLKSLQAIRLDKIYPRYGVPNDMLVKCNIANCVVKEIAIRPVYRIGEQSKMRIHKVIPKMSWLLLKLFFTRLWLKYLFRDFHPLFLLYHFAFALIIIDLFFIVDIFNKLYFEHTRAPTGNYITFLLLSLTSFQSVVFAMWMDIQDNQRLYRS